MLGARRIETGRVARIAAAVANGKRDRQVGPFRYAKLIVADDPASPGFQLDVVGTVERWNRDVREQQDRFVEAVGVENVEGYDVGCGVLEFARIETLGQRPADRDFLAGIARVDPVGVPLGVGFQVEPDRHGAAVCGQARRFGDQVDRGILRALLGGVYDRGELHRQQGNAGTDRKAVESGCHSVTGPLTAGPRAK